MSASLVQATKLPIIAGFCYYSKQNTQFNPTNTHLETIVTYDVLHPSSMFGIVVHGTPHVEVCQLDDFLQGLFVDRHLNHDLWERSASGDGRLHFAVVLSVLIQI